MSGKTYNSYSIFDGLGQPSIMVGLRIDYARQHLFVPNNIKKFFFFF